MVNRRYYKFGGAYLLIAVGLMLSFSGCRKPPENSTPAGHGFVVEKLFTHEGCSVYRFYDSINPRYFTNCTGSTNWDENCGKNCRKSVTIQGK